ncbi:alpha/beta hydrolase [Betaproteobacteria bacterium]|nr:alpha/beta hydrolase [Betaproteobacteria bacterium]GHU45097.1 alpha/beta hydrolase [Betaproteobacteria bacterium]
MSNPLAGTPALSGTHPMKLSRLAKLLTVLSAPLILFGCAFAQKQFYYPLRGASQFTPANAGLAYEDVYFSSADGTRLHGWFIPALGETKGVILHVHGNAGKLQDHLAGILWLPQEHYAVFTFDYRGYGLSDDKTPNPKGLMEDTQAAIAWLKNRPETNAQKLLILAQSLGGNNAVAAVANGSREGIAGIVLDATFYSYSSIANDKLFGAGIFLCDKYSASQLIGQLAPIPVFIVHGDRDRVIPYQHAQKLFAAAGQPKTLRIVKDAGHLFTLDDAPVRAEVLNFFAAGAVHEPSLRR